MTDGPVLYRRHDGIVTLTLNRPKTLSSDQTVPRNIPGVRVRAKTWLEREGRFALGEGGADLLGAIASRGLTLRSCSCRGWSYRHAWGYIRRAEAVLGVKLTARRSGKGAARGMIPSRDGRAVLAALLSARRQVDRATGAVPCARPGAQ